MPGCFSSLTNRLRKVCCSCMGKKKKKKFNNQEQDIAKKIQSNASNLSGNTNSAFEMEKKSSGSKNNSKSLPNKNKNPDLYTGPLPTPDYDSDSLSSNIYKGPLPTPDYDSDSLSSDIYKGPLPTPDYDSDSSTSSKKSALKSPGAPRRNRSGSNVSFSETIFTIMHEDIGPKPGETVLPNYDNEIQDNNLDLDDRTISNTKYNEALFKKYTEENKKNSTPKKGIIPRAHTSTKF